MSTISYKSDMPTHWYVSNGQGVTLVCDNKESVLFWIDVMVKKGMAPNVQKIG